MMRFSLVRQGRGGRGLRRSSASGGIRQSYEGEQGTVEPSHPNEVSTDLHRYPVDRSLTKLPAQTTLWVHHHPGMTGMRSTYLLPRGGHGAGFWIISRAVELSVERKISGWEIESQVRERDHRFSGGGGVFPATFVLTRRCAID